jgi:hypothetical protein
MNQALYAHMNNKRKKKRQKKKNHTLTSFSLSFYLNESGQRYHGGELLQSHFGS